MAKVWLTVSHYPNHQNFAEKTYIESLYIWKGVLYGLRVAIIMVFLQPIPKYSLKSRKRYKKSNFLLRDLKKRTFSVTRLKFYKKPDSAKKVGLRQRPLQCFVTGACTRP